MHKSLSFKTCSDQKYLPKNGCDFFDGRESNPPIVMLEVFVDALPEDISATRKCDGMK